MKNHKRNCKVYDFLETTGLLQNGSVKEIEEAKKVYWNRVRKEWKKAKRAQCKSVTVFFDTMEAKKVLNAAQHLNLTQYVKQAALAAGNKHLIVDKIIVGEIRQALILHYIEIQTLMEENILPKEIASRLLKQVSTIETKTMKQLQ